MLNFIDVLELDQADRKRELAKVLAFVRKYSDEEDRDASGKWTSGGGGGSSADKPVGGSRIATAAQNTHAFIASGRAQEAIGRAHDKIKEFATSERGKEAGKEALSFAIQSLVSHGTVMLSHATGGAIPAMQGLDPSTWHLNEQAISHAISHYKEIAQITASQAHSAITAAVSGLATLRRRAIGKADDVDDVLVILEALLAYLKKYKVVEKGASDLDTTLASEVISLVLNTDVDKQEGIEAMTAPDGAVMEFLTEHAPLLAAAIEKAGHRVGGKFSTPEAAAKASMPLNTLVREKTGGKLHVVRGYDGGPIVRTTGGAFHYDQLEHHPMAKTFAKSQPGAGDVHQTTALGNQGGKRKAKDFKATLAEVKDGAGTKVVHMPNGIDDTEKADRALKPRDDGTAHSPFPHDANALGNLRTDQVPRFLGALTDQDSQEDKELRIGSLVAMQDRVDPAKVASMQETPSDKPPLVVRHDGRNYIADGHHRAAAAYLNGDKTINAKFIDLTAKDSALKRDEEWEGVFKLAKADADQNLVFGWASITHVDGDLVIDKQDDVISSEVLEKGAYDFVLHSRSQGDMHERKDVGRLVESTVFTLEKFEKCGLYAFDVDTKEQLFGWWTGFYTDDPVVWKKIKAGELPEFSIGGKAKRIDVDDE